MTAPWSLSHNEFIMQSVHASVLRATHVSHEIMRTGMLSSLCCSIAMSAL